MFGEIWQRCAVDDAVVAGHCYIQNAADDDLAIADDRLGVAPQTAKSRSGGLMIAVNSLIPNIPRLLMEKCRAGVFFGLKLLALAFAEGL